MYKGMYNPFKAFMEGCTPKEGYNVPKSGFPFWDSFFDEAQQKAFLDVALAGYSKELLDVKLDGGVLTISSKSPLGESTVEYSKKGIKTKAFKAQWDVLPDCGVDGVEWRDGLLRIGLKREDKEVESIEVA